MAKLVYGQTDDSPFVKIPFSIHLTWCSFPQRYTNNSADVFTIPLSSQSRGQTQPVFLVNVSHDTETWSVWIRLSQRFHFYWFCLFLLQSQTELLATPGACDQMFGLCQTVSIGAPRLEYQRLDPFLRCWSASQRCHLLSYLSGGAWTFHL